LKANGVKLDRPYSVNTSGIGIAFVTRSFGTNIEINRAATGEVVDSHHAQQGDNP